MARRLATILFLAALPTAYPVAAPRAQSEAPPPRAADMDKVQIDVFQRRMVADPAMMDKIRALQDDPTFQEILDDPEIAAALESGDTTALMANPKVSALVNHPTVRELTDKLDQ